MVAIVALGWLMSGMPGIEKVLPKEPKSRYAITLANGTGVVCGKIDRGYGCGLDLSDCDIIMEGKITMRNVKIQCATNVVQVEDGK